MADRRERLATLRRELARQNAEWERAKEALGRVPEGTFAIPRDILEQIDACAPTSLSGININAVRG